MSSKGRLWLGQMGNELELPNMSRTFSEEEFEICTEGRTASGRLVIDVRAIKKRFVIEYSTVTNDVLEILRAIYALGNILSFKVERYDGSIDTYKVRIRPFSRKRIAMALEWLWEGIKIELEEV